MKIWMIALITLKEGIRHRLLYGTMLVGFVFMVFSILFSGLFMRDVLKIILDLCLSTVSLCGLFVPFFLAVTLLSGDIEARTIYTILARPISRTEYILGRFFGLNLLTAFVMGILTIAVILSASGARLVFADYFFSSANYLSIVYCSIAAWLGIMVLNSTVILWCSLTTSSFLATLLTFATYIVGYTVEDLVRFMIMESKRVHITPVVEKTVNVALYVFPNLAAFDMKHLAAYGLPVPWKEVALLIIYGFSYIVAILAISILYFRNRDLP